MTAQLDPDAQALLEVVAAIGAPPTHTLPVAEARARMRAAFADRDTPLALHDVRDVSLPTPAGALRCRLYRPRPGVLPVALFLHGGGWTLNDIDTHDRLCRRIAERSGWVLASLDYRRAPEHVYPAALEDAYHGYRWLLDNAARIGGEPRHHPAVIGESSGGALAAGLTLLLRDAHGPTPSCQILAYPVVDRYDSWPSYRERGTGYALDRELLRWYLDNYIPPAWDPRDPYLYPAAAADLSGLPPALIMTAEFDPLRDEGRAYAERLAGAGVAVEHVHAEDQMHGFLMMDKAVPRAGELIDRLALTLARLG